MALQDITFKMANAKMANNVETDKLVPDELLWTSDTVLFPGLTEQIMQITHLSLPA